MPELIAKSALEGRGPLTLGQITLAEADVGPVNSIAVFPGGAKTVAKALKLLGLKFPASNSFSTKGAARIVWTGREQAFLIGVEVPALEGAAVTDQSGGWVTLTLSGIGADEALMRLVPIDLRPSGFPVGRAVRAPLNHMNMILLRSGAYAFDLMVFRSMARTAWHELEAAMLAMEARAALKA